MSVVFRKPTMHILLSVALLSFSCSENLAIQFFDGGDLDTTEVPVSVPDNDEDAIIFPADLEFDVIAPPQGDQDFDADPDPDVDPDFDLDFDAEIDNIDRNESDERDDVAQDDWLCEGRFNERRCSPYDSIVVQLCRPSGAGKMVWYDELGCPAHSHCENAQCVADQTVPCVTSRDCGDIGFTCQPTDASETADVCRPPCSSPGVRCPQGWGCHANRCEPEAYPCETSTDCMQGQQCYLNPQKGERGCYHVCGLNSLGYPSCSLGYQCSILHVGSEPMDIRGVCLPMEDYCKNDFDCGSSGLCQQALHNSSYNQCKPLCFEDPQACDYPTSCFNDPVKLDYGRCLFDSTQCVAGCVGEKDCDPDHYCENYEIDENNYVGCCTPHCSDENPCPWFRACTYRQWRVCPPDTSCQLSTTPYRKSIGRCEGLYALGSDLCSPPYHGIGINGMQEVCMHDCAGCTDRCCYESYGYTCMDCRCNNPAWCIDGPGECCEGFHCVTTDDAPKGRCVADGCPDQCPENSCCYPETAPNCGGCDACVNPQVCGLDPSLPRCCPGYNCSATVYGVLGFCL